jgi:hypothetical protein
LEERCGLEAAEAVGDVDVDGVGGVLDRGGWRWLGGEGGQEPREAIEGRGVEIVLGGVSEEALSGPVRQAVLGGEGLDRFA